jgi:hypothetical protein
VGEGNRFRFSQTALTETRNVCLSEEFVSCEQKVNIGMAQRLDSEGRRLNQILARARELAEQVRETAERVHQQARESHRLTEVARQNAERGRVLSKAGRDEARAVIDGLKQVEIAGNGKRRTSGGSET